MFKKAYTMIEILIVLIILALIMGGGVAAGLYAMNLAKDTRKKDTVEELATTITAFYSANYRYPIATSTDASANGNFGTLYSAETGSESIRKYVGDFVFKGEPCASADTYSARAECYAYLSNSTGSGATICARLILSAGRTTTVNGKSCYCRSLGNGAPAATTVCNMITQTN